MEILIVKEYQNDHNYFLTPLSVVDSYIKAKVIIYTCITTSFVLDIVIDVCLVGTGCK